MKTTLQRALCVATGVVVLPAVPTYAEPVDSSTPGNSFLERETLTDDWFRYGPALREAGIDLRLEWSQFYQGMIEGTGDKTWQYGSHLDAQLKVDFSKWGLWDGLSLTAQGVWNAGESVNGYSGTAFPVNVALFFPDVNTTDGVAFTSLYLTQNFGDLWSVSIGKFNNATEGIRSRPIAGGGGVDTFWNLNPAVTSSGLVPAGTYAATVSLKTQPVSFFAQIYDPVDAFNKTPFADMFENGVAVNGAATLTTSIAGLTGYYGISGSYSTAEKTDLNSIFVPGGPIGVFAEGESGAYAVALTMQQYLFQDPNDPTRGWGIFGALTRSDANPTPLQLSYLIGIGGSSFLPNRPDDRWGVAFSRFGVSDELKDDLALFKVQDEYAVEAFYNLAVTPWFRVTADLQWVRPAGGTFDDAWFAGLSTYVKF